MAQQEGWVYVYLMQPTSIGSDGMYKIGMSRDPERRRKRIEYERGWPLRILVASPSIDAHAAERYLHQLFAPRRMFGEWFDLRPYEIAFIHRYLRGVYKEAIHTFKYFQRAARHPGWEEEGYEEDTDNAVD